jgi:hypothetical protein
MNNVQKLAEFIGILLGDGNLHKKSDCITIVGSLEDFYYYTGYVIPLIKSLFNGNPKLRKRNDRNSYYIDFNSKETMDYLTKDIGLIRGNKINAKVPSMIIENRRLIPPFLRGLFDTDGCLKFSKQTRNENYYPRIQYCFRDSKFTWQVKNLLDRINLAFCSWEDNRHNKTIFFQMSGSKNLEKWMEIVNSNNYVHKSKYLFWKKFGHYQPKSSLISRVEALNLNMNI